VKRLAGKVTLVTGDESRITTGQVMAVNSGLTIS